MYMDKLSAKTIKLGTRLLMVTSLCQPNGN